MSEPAGIIMPFAGTVAPENYLFCDGSAVSRTTYATLYAVIGDTFGAGDGSSTFNLPDLGGRVPLGVSQSHALGTTGGSETVTLTESELPAHVHEVPQHGHANTIGAKTPEFSHTITQAVFKYTASGSAKSGSGRDFKPYTGTSTGTASRATNAAVNAHGAANCTMGGSITNKTAFNTDAAGEGASHNNMQPYLPMNFVISTGE